MNKSEIVLLQSLCENDFELVWNAESIDIIDLKSSLVIDCSNNVDRTAQKYQQKLPVIIRKSAEDWINNNIDIIESGGSMDFENFRCQLIIELTKIEQS